MTKIQFEIAEDKLENLLQIVTKKGSFDLLTEKEADELEFYTAIVKKYEDENFKIITPQTIQNLISFKMFEKKMKQKDVAKLLKTTDTKLSEIMNYKRKPNVSFLKSVHEIFEVDGNLLLKMV